MKQNVDQQNVPRWTKKNFIATRSTNICINIKIFRIMSAVNIKCFSHNTVLVTFSNQHNYSGVLRMKVTVTHNKIQRKKKRMSCGFIQMSVSPRVNRNSRVYSQNVQSSLLSIILMHCIFFFLMCILYAFYWLLKGAPSVCQSSEPEQMGCSPRPINTAVSHKILWFYSWKNQPFCIHSLCIRLNTVPVWPLIKNRNWQFDI